MKKIGIITLTRQNSLAYAALKKIVGELGYTPICGEAIGSEALFLPLEEIHLVGYDFLGPFFRRAGFSEADGILISAPYTANLFSLPKVIRSLRAVSAAPVVLGGNEATNNHRNLMEYRFVPFVRTLVDVGPDFIVQGAAEGVLPALLPLMDREMLTRPWTAGLVQQLLDIPNLVFWVPPRKALVATRRAFTGLSEKEVFSVVKYGTKSAAVTFQRACLWAKKSRGGCLFCAIAAQFGENFHCSVETDFFVGELVRFLKNNKAIKHIDIWDDTFNIHDRWLAKICGHLEAVNRQAERRITYSCFLRPTGITPELTARLKAANIKAAFIGADAVTEVLSRRLRRGNTVSELNRCLAVLSRAGIAYNLSVQLFSPESTLEDVELTAELALDHITDSRSAVHVHLYMFPLFGAAIYRLLKARNNLKSIPAPLLKAAGESGFEALPVAYDYRHYDPDVETVKQKTCRRLGVEASFFVRTYPGDSVDAGRLKELLAQVKHWCLEANKAHPIKSLWILCLLSREGREKGLSREQLIDLLSRNEPASAIPEDLRQTHGDFGYRFTLSRSFNTVMEGLLRKGWVRKTGDERYALTPPGEAYLCAEIHARPSNPFSLGAYGRLGGDAVLEINPDPKAASSVFPVQTGEF